LILENAESAATAQFVGNQANWHWPLAGEGGELEICDYDLAKGYQR
jgi:hypothetical protein